MADDSGEPEDIGMEENVGVAWGGFDVSFKSHVLRLMQKGNLADVTLSNGTENFKCHRVILAACSPYFEKLFNDNASNTHMVVFLKGVESWEINAVVNFIYTGRAEVQKHLLSRLFDLAKGLQLRGFNTEKSMYRGQQLHPKQLLQQIEEEGKRKQSQRSGSTEEELSFEIAESSVSSDKKSVKRRKFKEPENENVTRIHSDSEPTFFSGGEWVITERQFGGIKRKRLQYKFFEGDTVETLKKKLELLQSEEEQWKPKEQRVEAPKTNSGIHENEEGTSGSEEQHVEELEVKSKRQIKTEPEDEEECIEVGFEDLVEANSNTEVLELKERPPEPQTSKARKGLVKSARTYTVVGGRKVYKYEKWERDQVISALDGGLSLRQCSDVFNIPRKTLAKWKSERIRSECPDGDAAAGANNGEDAPGPYSSQQGLNSFLSEPPITYPPLDGNDRAERLKKAALLAMSGVTVRQAAVHYALPRTTLCAYMKRRGLSALKKPLPAATSSSFQESLISNISASTKKGEASQVSSEGFPCHGISDIVDSNEVNEYLTTIEQLYGEEDDIVWKKAKL